MKTISRRRSSTERRLFAIIAVGLIFVTLVFSPFRILGGVLEVVSWPLRALDAVAPQSLSSYFAGIETLKEENGELLRTLSLRDEELGTLRASIADFDALRDIRGKAPSDALVSAVILAPSQSPYDSLVIDRGEADGVRVGAIAFAYEGRPIGVVSRTLPRSSVVALFSSPGIETTVYVRGANVHAKATGQGAGVLAVLVPHGSVVSEGDEVLMPSLAPSVIGVVEYIDTDPSAPGTIVAVSQTDALTSLRFVAIEREPREFPTLDDIRENLRHASTTVDTLFLPLSDLASSTATTTATTSETNL